MTCHSVRTYNSCARCMAREFVASEAFPTPAAWLRWCEGRSVGGEDFEAFEEQLWSNVGTCLRDSVIDRAAQAAADQRSSLRGGPPSSWVVLHKAVEGFCGRDFFCGKLGEDIAAGSTRQTASYLAKTLCGRMMPRDRRDEPGRGPPPEVVLINPSGSVAERIVGSGGFYETRTRPLEDEPKGGDNMERDLALLELVRKARMGEVTRFHWTRILAAYAGDPVDALRAMLVAGAHYGTEECHMDGFGTVAEYLLATCCRTDDNRVAHKRMLQRALDPIKGEIGDLLRSSRGDGDV